MIAQLLQHHDWHGGQLLAFSAIDGPTDYDNALTARTSFGSPGLEIELPGACAVHFPLPTRGDFWVAGDCFALDTEAGSVRGAFLDAHHLLIEGPCQVSGLEEAIACHTQGRRTLLGAASRMDPAKIDFDLDAAIRARSRWLEGQALPAGLPEITRRTLTKMLSIMKTQVYSPAGQIRHTWTTPDRWPHRNMWLWDSVFHAIGWRHIDLALAKSMLSAVVDWQREDGFIAHMMSPYRTSQITQPPVLALGAKLVNDVAPDKAWIGSLYPKLSAYVEWDLENRDSDGNGLVEWAIEGNPTSRSGESGMDNSPRFDRATQLDAVDFNAFLALECEILAGFAATLGRAGDANRWANRHRQLCHLIGSRLWSDEHAFFVDYDVDAQVQSPVLANSGFLPLICGAASASQAAHLAAHLRDPAMFGTTFPVPTVAARDTTHYAKDMWRGPTWINLNWLIAYGLDRYDMPELAALLRRQTTDEIELFYEKYGVAFEFYDDRRQVDPPQLLRKGRCAPEISPYHQVFHDYGWTATLYVDMVYARSQAPTS